MVIVFAFAAVRAKDGGSCRCRDRPRKATRIQDPPSAAPGFDLPSSVTLANKVTAPVVPSSFQIDPGPPLGSAEPHSPGMKVTPVPPSRTCSVSPACALTIGSPYAELAAT